jgi:glutaredoxin
MKLFVRVILPLLLLTYIAIETWAKLNHTSICGSEGCKLAGELLIFPSIYLNYLGGLAALGLLILGYLSIKREAFEPLFFASLYAAIGFETIMFAYQYYVNPEPCIFCAGVYGSLLVIALLSRPRYLAYALPAIAALWMALGMLAIPKNKTLIATDGTWLIHSETCPHCKKVKTHFAENNITYHSILVQDINARAFLKTLDIDSIPVLVIKKANHTIILKGDKPIIEHYQASKPVETASSSSSDTVSLTGNDTEGCSLDNQFNSTPGEEGGCEQDAAVPLR